MCNINALFCNKEIEGQVMDVVSFMQSVSAVSYLSNKDGDGFFTNDETIVTSKTKVNYLKNFGDIKKAKYVISHQRISTCGFTHRNTQPIGMDRYIIVHNGIFSDYSGMNKGKEDKSDTRMFLEELENHPSKDPEIAIKDLLNEQSGFYSVFIYDKVTKRIFYCRNPYADIFAYEYVTDDNSYIFVTTKEDNKLFLELLGEGTCSEMELQPLDLCEVCYIEDCVFIYKIDELKVVEDDIEYTKALPTYNPNFDESAEYDSGIPEFNNNFNEYIGDLEEYWLDEEDKQPKKKDRGLQLLFGEYKK